MQNTNRKGYTAVLIAWYLLLVFKHFGSWGDSTIEYLNSLAERSREIEGCCNEAEFRFVVCCDCDSY